MANLKFMNTTSKISFAQPGDKVNKINLNKTRPKSDTKASIINNKVFVSKFITFY